MGVPVIDAASEAESQCAELVKKKVVWGMASEDMDSLTFGAPVPAASPHEEPEQLEEGSERRSRSESERSAGGYEADSGRGMCAGFP